MSLKNSLSENIILPFSDFMAGQSVTKHLKLLQKSQFWSKEQIIAYQNQKLDFLINHAFNTVPYYRDLMNRYGLKPRDIREFSDLSKLPILTKAIIKKEGINRFTSSKIPRRMTMPQSSSGSTGEPLFYTTTKEAYSMNIAANLRGWYWMGYRLGDRYVKLSQNPRKAPLKRLQDHFSNNLYLATNPLTPENFSHILHQIENYKPKVIRCYPDPLLMLARYKKEHQGFNYKPLAITTTGNTLFPETRMEIEVAFGCKIFDSYSCEGNATVFECPSHSGYHSTEEYGISEVVNESGMSISKGIGKLISTDLWNLSHPFIRYDTQDLVEIDQDSCRCGRSHLKYKRIIGRDNDVIVASKNQFIVHNFTIFFSRQDLPSFGAVEKFQVRKSNDVVIFYLVPTNDYNDATGIFIVNYWENEMGLKVKIELVDNLPLTPSGKHKFVINE